MYNGIVSTYSFISQKNIWIQFSISNTHFFQDRSIKMILRPDLFWTYNINNRVPIYPMNTHLWNQQSGQSNVTGVFFVRSDTMYMFTVISDFQYFVFVWICVNYYGTRRWHRFQSTVNLILHQSPTPPPPLFTLKTLKHTWKCLIVRPNQTELT